MAFFATAAAFGTSPINEIIPNTNALVVYSCLASHADNDQGKCWPGIERIATICKLSNRAVQRSLNELEKIGLVVRKFRLGQSTIYYLPRHADGGTPPPDDLPPPPPSVGHPESVIEFINEQPIVPPAKAVPVPRPVPPTKAVARPAAKPVVLVIDDVPESLLADWLAVRKSKKQLVLTETAVDALRAEAAKAGMTINEAIRTCVLAGWARFEAHWVKPKVEVAAAPITPPVVQPPEPPMELASPEVIAAAIANAKERIRAANSEAKDPKARARETIKSKIDGKPISLASLNFAAFVLGFKHWKDAAQCFA